MRGRRVPVRGQEPLNRGIAALGAPSWGFPRACRAPCEENNPQDGRKV